MQNLWLPHFNQIDIEVIEKSSLYSGHLELQKFTFKHRLFNGTMSKPIIREVLVKPPFVGVLLFDPEAEVVIMVEQVRVGAVLNDKTSPWILELVAGLIEPNETALNAAKRETFEETGCQMLASEFICSYILSPGTSTEQAHLYCGHVKTPVSSGFYGLETEDEDIKTHIFKLSEIFGLLQNGLLTNAASIIGIMWLKENVEKLKAKWI